MIPFATLDRPRVLIVALAGIGNLLMASPLFRTLKEANPTTEIDVLVAPRGTTEVLEANPRIRRVLRGSAAPSAAAAAALVPLLRRARYDVGIVAHPGQRWWSAGLLALGGVRRRLGHRYRWAGSPQRGFFLTDALPLRPHASLSLADRSAHDAVQNLRLLEPLGISSDPSSAVYDFPLISEDRERAAAWLAERNLAAATLIGMHPGAHADLAYKRWPTERWSELGDRLSEQHGATILVFGGPEERVTKTEVCARMGKAAVAVELPLRATAALIARCAFFVSNDSGLMHVAVSQQVPTFGLFGPTDERRTAPWGPSGRVIRAPGTHPTYDVAGLREIGAQRGPDASLAALTVDHVLREVAATAGDRVPHVSSASAV